MYTFRGSQGECIEQPAIPVQRLVEGLGAGGFRHLISQECSQIYEYCLYKNQGAADEGDSDRARNAS
jgi:hypothetical protein